MSATRTMVREDTAIILNDDSVVSSFGFEKNLSTITAWVLILLLSYDKSTIFCLLRISNNVRWDFIQYFPICCSLARSQSFPFPASLRVTEGPLAVIYLLKGELRWEGHSASDRRFWAVEAPTQTAQRTLLLILSKQKIFRYFMHMRAKTICGF